MIQLSAMDTSSGSELLVFFTGNTYYIPSMKFSPDGTRIVSGSDDNTVRIWDGATGNTTSILKGHMSYHLVLMVVR